MPICSIVRGHGRPAPVGQRPTTTPDGAFHDIVRHTADQEQTTTYCSSVDPWHEPSDLISTRQAQVGFDLFYGVLGANWTINRGYISFAHSG